MNIISIVVSGIGVLAMALASIVSTSLIASAAATTPDASMSLISSPAETTPDARTPGIDPTIVKRLFELDPDRISAGDVAEVLARVPAPQIILFQGSVAPITMEPFAQFLIAMGYPSERIKNPRDGTYSASAFADSARIAGMLAWYYESEGVRPMMIGHSGGGMLTIRVLHDLAGNGVQSISVWDPVTDAALPRTTIIDPSTGALQPVVGLRLPYAAALATGKLPRLLLGQWRMLSSVRKIPDSVEEFTGFLLEWDLIAGEFPGGEPYAAMGSAKVRNVQLPATYTHLGLPSTSHLAQNATLKAWIDAYMPGGEEAIPETRNFDTVNLIHAADIWHSIKKHWCIEARRLIAARQGNR